MSEPAASEHDDEDLPHVVLHPFGERRAYSAGTLRESWDDLSEEELLVVVLNDIPFMDATCLSTLLGGIGRFRANGGTAVVVCGKGSLTRLFHTSGLDSVALVAESYGQALKLLRDLDK